jgi:hypothetical protein
MKDLMDFDRAELVRLQRMRRCHEEDRPTPREVATALAMVGAARRSRREPRLTRTLAIAAAVSLSTLGAFATTEKLGLTAVFARWHSQSSPSATPRPSAPPPLLPRERERRPQVPAAAVPSTSSSTVSEPAPIAAPRVRSVIRAPDTAPRTADTAAEAWSRAAAALKLGNQAAAQDALRELARSEDAETRSAALLTRAELDLVNGEEARARAVLSALAERGATPFVRQRARQILAGEL